MTNKTKIIIIVPSAIILIVIVLVIVIASGIKPVNNNGNQAKQNVNAISNANSTISNDNTNQPPAIITSKEITVAGTVFIKGYDTPSESYGVSSADGNEIGLGKYDSMKEQFRPYIGDKIKVTFEKVCHSTDDGCCLSLFFYCGTVKSWEPETK